MKRDLCFIRTFRPKQDCKIFDLFHDNISDVPAQSGVYIIASEKQRFVYPNNTTSRVIYIGKSDNLQRRFREHRAHLQNLSEDFKNNMWCNNRYHYMDSYGACVYYYKCQKQQEAKDLESRIMEAFYERYFATPIGNGARSFRK